MTKTKHMVWMGILIAVSIVLSRFLSFSAWNVKIGFAFIPIVIGGSLRTCAGRHSSSGCRFSGGHTVSHRNVFSGFYSNCIFNRTNLWNPAT